MSAVRQLQESAWAAECRHDLDALMEHFTPDATFHATGSYAKRGHDKIRELTEDFLREFPQVEVEVLSDYGNGETSAAIEFRATVVNTAGETFVIQGVQLVEVENGKFKSVRGYEEQPVAVSKAG